MTETKEPAPARMFMVVPPLNSWDKPETAYIGISTLSRTAGEAWRKQTRDEPSKVQAWFDRGWRLREVEVSILPPPPNTGADK